METPEPEQGLRRFPPGTRVGSLVADPSPAPVAAGDEDEEELEPAVPPDEEPAEEDDDDESDEDEDEEPERIAASAPRKRRAELLAERKAKAEARKARKAEADKSVFSPGESAVPDEEKNPRLRGRPSLEVGEDFPDLTDPRKRTFANLADINASYLIGDVHHIKVERTFPRTWQNSTIKGILGDIRWPMGDTEFREIFGGGDYLLRVYGPSPNARQDGSGRLITKPLTPAIKYSVPGECQPNVDPEHLLRRPSRKEPMDLRTNGRPTTPADASLTSAMLRHTEQSQARADQAQEARLREAREGANSTVDAVSRTAQTTIQLLERELELSRKRADQMAYEQQQMREKYEADMRSIREEASKVKQPATELIQSIHGIYGRNADTVQAQITQMQAQHNQTIQTLTEQHRRDLERERDSAKRDRELTQESHARELQRQQERYETLRAEKERQLDDLRTSNASRLQDVRSQHETEIRNLRNDYEAKLSAANERAVASNTTEKQLYEMRLQTEKQSMKYSVEVLEREVARLDRELKEARAKNAEKEDLGSQIQKVTEMAGMLGLSKGEEGSPQPSTWQERLAAAVGDLLSSVPETVGNIQGALQARNLGLQMQAQLMNQQAAQQQVAVQQQEAAQRRIPTRQFPQGAPIRGFGGTGDPDAAPAGTVWEAEGIVAQATSGASGSSSAQAGAGMREQAKKQGGTAVQGAEGSPPPSSSALYDRAHGQPLAQVAQPTAPPPQQPVMQQPVMQQPVMHPHPQQQAMQALDDDDEFDDDDGPQEQLTPEQQQQAQAMLHLLDQIIERIEVAFGQEADINATVAELYRGLSQQLPPQAILGLAQQFTPEVVTARLEEAHEDSDLLTMEGQKYVRGAYNAFIIQGKAATGQMPAG